MSGLQIAWMLSLLITVTALPVGMIRMLVYRSGETDHTQTMLIAAWVALGIGSLALVALAATSLLILF
jgi:hypothetical protein